MQYFEMRTSYYEIGGHICESRVPESTASRSVSKATTISSKSGSRGTGGRSAASSTPSTTSYRYPYSYGNPVVWLAVNALLGPVARTTEAKRYEVTGQLPYD